MDFNYICDACNRDCLIEEVEKEEEIVIRGKIIKTPITILVCKECGAEVFDEELANKALKKLNDKYIELYGMSVEEIKSVREQFVGLGQRAFAKLLGIGSASVIRHETGEIPSEKHLEIYRKLKDNPKLIFEHYKENSSKLTKRELKKVDQILASWQEEGGVDEPSYIEDDEGIIEAIHRPLQGSIFSGYKNFDLDRFINMILFFSKEGVAKTSLMKLLWYSDCIYFKRQTLSISGAVYTRKKFGPVPKDHDVLLAHLQRMEIIEIDEEVINEQGWTKITVKAKREFDKDLFKLNEFDVLTLVKDVLGPMGSREISDYSHKERGWIETEEEQPIKYSFANELNEF